jgi:hypothetical protein
VTALVLALVFLAGSFGLLLFMRLWLRRRQANPRDQAILSFIVIGGALLGVWLSLRVEYAVGPNVRFSGAPLPLVVFHKEGDHWVDIPHARPVMAVVAMANAATVAAALAGPWVLWLALRRTSPPNTHDSSYGGHSS